ncbi:MAG: 50S ribosomal protein L25 [Planctomycetota bacterium]|nr:MAG: 50S ribosomal protein L25 [Planctomycetota bacterium]
MSTLTTLETQARPGVGSRASRKARNDGFVPVNIYGHGQSNASLTIKTHDLVMALNTTAQIFTLTVDGKDESCLVREVQYDTYGQYVLHVDFTRIDMSEEVHVDVQLEFRGHPVGVAEGGQQVTHHASLAVVCRADAIPETVLLDIAAIEIGSVLHAGEIEMPAGVKLDESKMGVDEPIIGVAAPKAEEPEVEEEAEAEGEGEGAEGEAGGESGDAKASDGGKGKGEG